MRKVDFVPYLTHAVLVTEDLHFICFVIEKTEPTDLGLAVHGQILVPHKGKGMTFGVLLLKSWSDDEAQECYLAVLRHAKKQVEEALKSGLFDEKPEAPPPPALLGADGTPLQPGQSTPPLRLAQES